MTVFTRSMLLFLIISPCICLLLYTFLLWHAMYRADYTVARCPSACLCVTRQYSVETAKHIIRLFHRRVDTRFGVAAFRRRSPNADAEGLGVVQGC